MKKLQVLFRGVNLSATSLWSSCKCSFLLLSAHQLAHSSLILLDFTKPGGFIYHISPCHPSPSLSLTLSFIFLIFNNSLSALWSLIKMNSVCCRLLPSRLSLCLCLWLSVVSLLCTVLTLFLKIFPSPPHLQLPWCPPHPSVHRLPPGLPSAQSSCLPLCSLLFSPSISLRLTQQSIMCRALDTGLPQTHSFIRTLRSRNHSFLSSAGLCHLLHHPSHLADDQYELVPSAPPSPPCSFPSPHLLLLLLLYTAFLKRLALCSTILCEKTARQPF